MSHNARNFNRKNIIILFSIERLSNWIRRLKGPDMSRAAKRTEFGIKLQFLLGNESEQNLCVLRTMYPEKRNFLGSIANALPAILEAGLAKDKEKLDAILLVLNDAQK